MTSETGNVMIHFLLISFSFPVFVKLELTISAISYPIDLKFWSNTHMCGSYKIMPSKTGNVIIHFLLIWFSFPVLLSWNWLYLSHFLLNWFAILNKYLHVWTLQDKAFKNRKCNSSFPVNLVFISCMLTLQDNSL